MKYTEKELLECAQKIKDYCHNTCCVRCIFGNNEETRKIKGKNADYRRRYREQKDIDMCDLMCR